MAPHPNPLHGGEREKIAQVATAFPRPIGEREKIAQAATAFPRPVGDGEKIAQAATAFPRPVGDGEKIAQVATAFPRPVGDGEKIAQVATAFPRPIGERDRVRGRCSHREARSTVAIHRNINDLYCFSALAMTCASMPERADLRPAFLRRWQAKIEVAALIGLENAAEEERAIAA